MVDTSSRRSFLKLTGGAGTFALAGCLNRGGGGEFPDENIRFIVPYAAGSGFDAYARAIAEPWQERLGTEIVVENVTGAGGRTATETLYSADADGYTVGILNIPGFSVSQLTIDNVEYDLTEMTHLGRVVRGTYVTYVGPDSDIETWEDLAAMDTVDWGIEGFGSSNSFATIIFAEAADINVNFVTGYASPEIRQAVIQGELDAAQHTASTARSLIEDGSLKPILQYSDEPLDWLPDVPLTEEVDQFQGFADALNISRIISAPPEVEDDRATTLEDTLWETFNSDALSQWSEESGRSLQGQLRGEEAAGVVEQSLETFEQYLDTIQQYTEN